MDTVPILTHHHPKAADIELEYRAVLRVFDVFFLVAVDKFHISLEAL